jgi:hypothetical protein
LYNKIKHDIVLEEYLIKEKNFKNRQLIAKFRTSDHCLQIETGRYINIPHQHKHNKYVNVGEIFDQPEPYHLKSSDCFMKVQTTDKRSEVGN